jgi:hypothetical protein
MKLKKKNKMSRRDRIQTRRAKKSRMQSGMTRPHAESSGPMGQSHRVSTSSERAPIKLGAAADKKNQYGKGGKVYKNGGKFPDLTGDGKVTRADILKGRGVGLKKKK